MPKQGDLRDPHGDQRMVISGCKVSEAAGAMILLHGRGALAEDILNLGEAFDLPQLALFAPEAAENIWYPYSFLAPVEQNEPWLTSALNRINALVNETLAGGIPREKIVIAGFSQGACLAAEFVAQNPSRYGGLIAFTGGLFGPPETDFHYLGNLDGTPAFLGAGDPDPYIPWNRVEQSASVLSAMGARVILRRYPGMPHTVSREEVEQAKRAIYNSHG